jgi:hypothetical protein
MSGQGTECSSSSIGRWVLVRQQLQTNKEEDLYAAACMFHLLAYNAIPQAELVRLAPAHGCCS